MVYFISLLKIPATAHIEALIVVMKIMAHSRK